MWDQWNGHRGWGGGSWVFAPMLLFGAALFLLFFIFKTGLWIPLLLIGMFFWFFSPTRGGWQHRGRHWAREWSERGQQWGQRGEKWAQRWQAEGMNGRGWSWGCDDSGSTQTTDSEKSKRETSNTSEPIKRKPSGIDYV